MTAANPTVPEGTSSAQPAGLRVGDAVRPKGTRGPREAGVVRQVDDAKGLAFCYFHASGHRRWFRVDALVPTGGRAAPKGGAA